MVNMCIKSKLIINNNAQILATFNPLNLNRVRTRITAFLSSFERYATAWTSTTGRSWYIHRNVELVWTYSDELSPVHTDDKVEFNTVDFVESRLLPKPATKSTVVDTVNFVGGFGNKSATTWIRSACRGRLCCRYGRLYCQCVGDQSVTVDFQRSRPCWIHLCRQCVLGFEALDLLLSAAMPTELAAQRCWLYFHVSIQIQIKFI